MAADAARLNGQWKSGTHQTQLGNAIEVFCFRGDGTVDVTTETQAGRLANRGTYRVSGNTIVFVWSTGAEATASFRFDGDMLILVTGDTTETRFRSTGACR